LAPQLPLAPAARLLARPARLGLAGFQETGQQKMEPLHGDLLASKNATANQRHHAAILPTANFCLPLNPQQASADMY
jgi:hypothetical protein